MTGRADGTGPTLHFFSHLAVKAAKKHACALMHEWFLSREADPTAPYPPPPPGRGGQAVEAMIGDAVLKLLLVLVFEVGDLALQVLRRPVAVLLRKLLQERLVTVVVVVAWNGEVMGGAMHYLSKGLEQERNLPKFGKLPPHHTC